MTHQKAAIPEKLIGAVGVVPLLLTTLPLSVIAAPIKPARSGFDQGSQTIVNAQESYIQIEGGLQVNNNLFHQFESFNVETGNIADFVTQPNVQSVIGQVSGSASYIDGTLQVSGSEANLYLINPAGILFGPNAQLNLGGSFTATTADQIEFGDRWLNVLDTSAEQANYQALQTAPTGYQFSAAAPGAVVNQANLGVAAGQTIQLIGGNVVNTGNLSAPGGAIALSAHSNNESGNSLVRLDAEGALLSIEIAAENLTSQNLDPQVSPLSLPALLTGAPVGTVNDLKVNSDGSVSLSAQTLSSLPETTTHSVNTASGSLLNAGSADVSTSFSGESGGDLTLLGDQIEVVGGTLDASGKSGGGRIRIGGDYQGQGELTNANSVLFSQNAVATADATVSGNGGQVIVWSDGETTFNGTVSARGAQQGTGGLVETSGLEKLAIGGRASVSTAAASGKLGTWLLDPIDLTIVASGGVGSVAGGMNEPSSATTLDAATLVSALASNNVTLQATESITVDAPVTSTTNSDLRLEAPTVNLNAPVSVTPGSSLTGTASTVNVGPDGNLYAGISFVANGGTVNLAEATYTTNGIQLFRPVTLQGRGFNRTIIEGEGSTRLFTIDSGIATLDGLTLQGGVDTTGNQNGGGAIRVANNASLNLLNSRVRNNSSNSSGGGLILSGPGTSQVRNSTIENNVSGEFGGGIFAKNGHELVLSDSVIRSNEAINGGGIDGFLNSGDITIQGSMLYDNVAANEGGAFSFGHNGGQLTVENSTVRNNTAANRGGGLASNGVPVRIVDSIFRDNEVTDANNGLGGAIATVGDLDIAESRFEGNRAGKGGAISLLDNGVTQVRSTTFEGNRAVEGGAIALEDNSQLEMYLSTLSNNTATLNGGAIHDSTSFAGRNLIINNGTFSGNQAVGGDGGGLYRDSTSEAKLTSVTVAENTAGANGGGIYNTVLDTLQLQSSIVAQNSSSLLGPDISGSIVSRGNNIVQTRDGSSGYITSDFADGTNPQLSPLADNGGDTFTHAHSRTSPAYNAGSGTSRDQRGLGAVGIRDVGAYEWLGVDSISVIAGDNQSTTVDTLFDTSLQLQAIDTLGGALSGVEIRFTAPATGASNSLLSQPVAITDNGGFLSLPISANTVAGDYSVLLETTDQQFSQNVSFTNLPDEASALTIVSGDNQTAEVSTAFTDALMVQVSDRFNNALIGESVSFALPTAGAGSLLSNPAAITNAAGQATTTATANDAAGSYTVDAIAAGLTQQFTLTNTPAATIDPDTVPDPTPDTVPDPTPEIPPVVSEENQVPTSVEANILNITGATIDSANESSSSNALAQVLESEEKQRLSGQIDFFDAVSFAQVEQQLTEEYARYWQRPLEGETTLDEVQQLLREAEQHHQSKTALIYALFVPGTQSRAQENAVADSRYPSLLSQRLLRRDTHNEQDQLLLMLISADGEPVQHLVDVTRKDITLQAALLGIEISNFIDTGFVPLAQQLYSWLLEPVETEIEQAGIDNIMYVLDEGLRTTPLAAMMKGESYAIERYGLSMLPSAGLLQNDFGESPAAQNVLAAGADTFASQEALPAVPTELALVQAASESTNILLNEDFNLNNVVSAQATSPRNIMHLATHAVFNPGSVDRSYIQLWEEKLTLDNLDTLSLQDLELLILSACTTALGNRQAELGFAGLAASLGVESSIGSLWNVSDIGTMALMAELYEQMRQQPLRFSALQQAQLALLEGRTRIESNRLITQSSSRSLPENLIDKENVDFSHPFFWSGFTLIGNPWW